MRLNNYSLHFLCFVLLFTLVIAAFWSGRGGPWLFDDKHNIVNLQNLQPKFLETHALWRGAQVNDEWRSRSFARLSFAASVKACGLTRSCFKTTNIVLQAFSSVAVYIFCLQLLALIWRPSVPVNSCTRIFLAFTVATIWALHPIQISTVLYAVQRMTILSTLFSVVTLIIYLRWRRSASVKSAFWYFPAALFAALLAFHSKENAVVIPLLIVCLEVFLLRPELSIRQRKIFYSASAAVLVLSTIFGFLLLDNVGFFDDFPNRPFSPWERLLSESRVIWHYLYWIVLPTTSHYTLFHDDLLISQSFFVPLTTLFSCLGLAVVSAMLFVLRRKYSLLAFAWFWFLLAHSVESSFLNLELVFEHRNHLPLVGLVFGLLVTLYQSIKNQQLLRLALPLVALAYCGLITLEKSKQWRSDGSMLVYESQFHPQSVRLNYKIAFLWLQLANATALARNDRTQLLVKAKQAFGNVAQANDYNIHGFIGLLYMQTQGLSSADEKNWQELYQRLQHAPLSADVVNLLSLLSVCYAKNQCDFPREKLERAYEILLSRAINPSVFHNAEADLGRLRLTKP